MDKNNDGLIPREDFIDGIMKTSKNITFILILKDVCKLTSVASALRTGDFERT
jgi:hypothetical protein